MQMELLIQEIGLKTSNMEKAKRNGLMEPNTMVNIKTAKNTETDN
jgi:hypothetical protein